MAFKLEKATSADSEERARVWSSSFQFYDIWAAILRDVKPEDEHVFFVELLEKRFKQTNAVVTKITEVGTKYAHVCRRLVLELLIGKASHISDLGNSSHGRV